MFNAIAIINLELATYIPNTLLLLGFDGDMKVRVNNVGAYDRRVLLRQGVLRPLLGEHFRAAAEEGEEGGGGGGERGW